MNKPIHFPTEEENQAAIREFAMRGKRVRTEQKQAAEDAQPALTRLVEACAGKSGQAYKIRKLLFSAWNGKPADLSDVLCLDWELKKDICAVLLAFGFEDAD